MRQHRSAQAVLALPEVNQDQAGVALIRFQLWRQRAAYIFNRRKGGDDQRNGGDDLAFFPVLRPAGTHGQRVFPNRDGQTNLLAQLADGGNGVIQRRVLAGFAAGRHPVGGQFDMLKLGHRRGRQVGDGLGHRHPARRGRIDHGQRRALTHGHGFTAITFVVRQRDGAIGHRHLPRPNHLVSRGQAAHCTVTNGDQEGFVSHGRVAQNAQRGRFQCHAHGIDWRLHAGQTLNVAQHARRLAEDDVHRHVHRTGLCIPGVGAQLGCIKTFTVDHAQLARFRGHAHHGERATLAFGNAGKALQVRGQNGQHVTLLRFIAPDFRRRQTGLFQRHTGQVKHRAPLCVVDQLRKGVGQTARAHIMDGQDRVVAALLPAAVNDLLGTAFDFRVAALHGIKIQIRRIAAHAHAGRGATAHANAHAGTAQLNQQGAGRQVELGGEAVFNRAKAARNHDGLVIAPARVTRRLLIGPEVTEQVRTAELIVECGAAQRAFNHDVQRRCNAVRQAMRIGFPCLGGIGQAQVGHGEAGQARLGLGAAAGCAFIADLTARAG